MTPSAPTVARRFKPPLAGLLAVCLLLAAGLLLTAFLSYRAAEQAAEDVLFSRAAEVAASFAASVRFAQAHAPEELTPLVKEAASDGVSVAVVTLDGKVVARAGPRRRPSDVALFGEPLQQLRLGGQGHRLDADARTLVYWRPLGLPPRVRRAWRRARREGRWGPHKRFGPPKRFRPGGDGPDQGWLRRWRRSQRQLTRVVVPFSHADALLSPARTMIYTAAGGSVLLLLLGGLLYRSARRAQLAQRQLQRREALSALGEMGAVLAHEIRTPLAAIKGNAQLIEEKLPGDARARSIVSESTRLERLVNGMLDFARPGEPQQVACAADELLVKAVEIVAPKAEAAGVPVITDPAGSSVRLMADPDQVLQVLVNLLQNAVEATEEVSAAEREPVVIRAQQRLGRLTFTVLDRGPGFADEHTDRYLRPFFSTKEKKQQEKGSNAGLGLAVARQIAQQHGGELRLEPRSGGGAQVSLILPAGSKRA